MCVYVVENVVVGIYRRLSWGRGFGVCVRFACRCGGMARVLGYWGE